jgi:membrane-associated phospholipid phosphatase
LLAQFLALWASYRRLILVVLLSVALAAFFSTLAPETRLSLWRGLLANRVLVALLLGLSIVTLSLLWSAGQRLDTWIFLLFNLRGYHPLWMDRVMWAVTQVGNGVFGFLMCAVFYFAGQRRLAIEMLAGMLTLWLCVEIFKALTERRRPYVVLEGTRIIGWRERGLSFPSGHTAQTFFMVTLLVQFFQAGALMVSVSYLLAIAVGFTRIYVGAHYPRDVLGGAILGSVWGILSVLAGGYLL